MKKGDNIFFHIAIINLIQKFKIGTRFIYLLIFFLISHRQIASDLTKQKLAN